MSKTDLFCNRAEAFEAHDDVPLSPSDLDSIGDIIQRRYSRRDVVRGSLGVVAAASLFGPAALASSIAPAPEDRFCFEEVQAGVDKTHHVAEGYQADVLLRWGDPLFSDSPAFDPHKQSAAAQLKQFGYNNDYIAFLPLDTSGDRGLLCINHEYTNEEVMFPGLARQDLACFPDMTAELVEIEMAAHGVTVVEVVRKMVVGRSLSTAVTTAVSARLTPSLESMDRRGDMIGLRRAPIRLVGALLVRSTIAAAVSPLGAPISPRKRTSTDISGPTRSSNAANRRRALAVRKPRATHAMVCQGSGKPGENFTTASTSTRSRTNRTGLVGSWKSIHSTRHQRR